MQRSATQRLSMACARHPWRALGAWFVVLCLALAANATLLGSALTTESEILTEPDSVKGLNLLDERFADRDDTTELVVVRTESGDVQSADFQATVSGLRQDIAAAEGVQNADRVVERRRGEDVGRAHPAFGEIGRESSGRFRDLGPPRVGGRCRAVAGRGAALRARRSTVGGGFPGVERAGIAGCPAGGLVGHAVAAWARLHRHVRCQPGGERRAGDCSYFGSVS